MTLQNLLRIQRLQAHRADAGAARRLLASARRNLADARVDAIGADTRFDAAYRCILQCATVGLWAHGLRPSTSQPGHHAMTLQCLPLTMDVSQEVVIVLDGLRKQRNLTDYIGDPVSLVALRECCASAEALLDHTIAWLRSHRPAWVDAR